MQCIANICNCKLFSIGDCGQLPSETDVYIISKGTQNTTVGSIIRFECVHTNSIVDLNKTLYHAVCLDDGFWHPDPQTTCSQTTAAAVTNGLLIHCTECCIDPNSIILLQYRKFNKASGSGSWGPTNSHLFMFCWDSSCCFELFGSQKEER